MSKITHNRDFKGVWIPKEIWLDNSLSFIEKVLLIEINSLDNKDGCFASNSYFGRFFGKTPQHISGVIKSLKEKDLITIEYEREGKQIKRRVVKISTRYSENLNRVLNKSEGGYSENLKDNNTSINNTNNNTEIEKQSKKTKEKFTFYNLKNILLTEDQLATFASDMEQRWGRENKYIYLYASLEKMNNHYEKKKTKNPNLTLAWKNWGRDCIKYAFGEAVFQDFKKRERENR